MNILESMLKRIYKRRVCAWCHIRPGYKGKDSEWTMNVCSHCWNKGL